MKKSVVLTRRDFVRNTAVLAVAASAMPAWGADRPRLKAAVLGHTGRGDYGHGLESIFARRPEVELVALADPDDAGRKNMSARIGAPRSYGDYRELLDKELPNVVSVAMRHADSHREIVGACLRAGAHVYAEKPFVTAPQEADELLALAQKASLKIAVAHTMRMMPIVRKFRASLGEGLLGDLVELRAYGKQDTRAGGEDMMVLGTHLFDLMRLFAGDPQSCSARVLQDGRPITRKDRRVVKDNVGYVAGDQVFAQFAFPNGVHATFTSAAKLRETVGHWGIEFHGSKGVARLNCDSSPKVFLRRTGTWDSQGRKDSWEPMEPALVQSPPEPNSGPVSDWLEAIVKNREPECSARNGAWAVEMVNAVYASALGNVQIRFPLQQRSHALA